MNNSNLEITLLSKDKIFGDECLEIFDQVGTKCEATDFAKALGIYTEENEKYCSWYITDNDYDGTLTDNELKNSEIEVDATIITSSGELENVYASNRIEGIRPVIELDDIEELKKHNTCKMNEKGFLEVTYGEYPHNIVDVKTQKELNEKYINKRLNKTGKTYTIDSITNDEYESESFLPMELEEYEFNNKKYVRVNIRDLNPTTILSNGQKYTVNDVVWIEVEPITWYLDEKEKLLISKKILASGIRMCDDGEYKYDFENTEIYYFLNSFFTYDILPKEEQIKNKSSREKFIKKIRERKNPYEFKLDEVSEEEIIKIAIDSDLSVFLHGPSSEGKSARVKEIDPECQIIYLRNATPESLNGKSVYNAEKNEMIDIKPSWLKKLEARCEKEPNKNHIVFFDEITNALPSIQGMAFNIVLDKEVNGIWKLPKNARIVAAGNEMSDSLAANQMSEPLFNRFAHVYIKTTVEGWLKWASEKDIHPAIYSYIASTNGKSLRTEYNGEKPNADPRKWEMASKMLKATNKPEALRCLLGEEVTKEFINFIKNPVLTIKDVLENNYDKKDLDTLNTAEKYATVYGLSQVKEDNLDEVREFVTMLGGEVTQLFDKLWIHNDASRLERLQEAKLANEQNKVKIKRK